MMVRRASRFLSKRTRYLLQLTRSCGIYFVRYAATSNAPTIGRKRRFSFTEDDDSASTCVKKAKAESVQAEVDTPQTPEVPKQKEGEDVKSVTQGVKDVELEDQDRVEPSSGPEEIPLPDSPGGTPLLDMKLADEETTTATPEEEVAEQRDVEDGSDTDSVASSSGQGGEVCEQGQPNVAPNDDTTAVPMSAASPLVEGAATVDGIHSGDTPTPTEPDV